MLVMRWRWVPTDVGWPKELAENIGAVDVIVGIEHIKEGCLSKAAGSKEHICILWSTRLERFDKLGFIHK